MLHAVVVASVNALMSKYNDIIRQKQKLCQFIHISTPSRLTTLKKEISPAKNLAFDIGTIETNSLYFIR